MFLILLIRAGIVCKQKKNNINRIPNHDRGIGQNTVYSLDYSCAVFTGYVQFVLPPRDFNIEVLYGYGRCIRIFIIMRISSIT